METTQPKTMSYLLLMVQNSTVKLDLNKLTITQILNVTTSVCCEYFNMQIEQTHKSFGRYQHIVKCRQICMWVIRTLTEGRKLSLIEIGKYYGGFDHTSVLHSIRVAQDYIDTDEQFKYDAETVLDRTKKQLTKIYNGI